MTLLTDVRWPPAPISGRRVTLRAARDADRSALIELLTSPDVRRHLGGPLSALDAAASVSGPLGRVPGSFVVAMCQDDTALGTVGFDRRDAGRPGHLRATGAELEISYSMLPAHWGLGLATEAVGLALQWAARTLDDHDVIACTQAANTASLALLDHLGFASVTQFREFDATQVLLVRDLAGNPPR